MPLTRCARCDEHHTVSQARCGKWSTVSHGCVNHRTISCVHSVLAVHGNRIAFFAHHLRYFLWHHAFPGCIAVFNMCSAVKRSYAPRIMSMLTLVTGRKLPSLPGWESGGEGMVACGQPEPVETSRLGKKAVPSPARVCTGAGGVGKVRPEGTVAASARVRVWCAGAGERAGGSEVVRR